MEKRKDYEDANKIGPGYWPADLERMGSDFSCSGFEFMVKPDPSLVLFDERVGVKPLMTNLANLLHAPILADVNPFGIGALSLPNVIVPLIMMNVPIVILLLLIRFIYHPEGMRDYMLALFTGFVVAYVVLTIIGTFFRGQQMILMWPWDPRQVRIE